MNDSEDFFAREKRREKLYEEGRRLFRQGKTEEALERFKRIFEDTTAFRDVEQIINDYYTEGEDEWLRKYRARFGDSNDIA